MPLTKRQTAVVFRNQSGAAIRRMIGFLQSKGFIYRAQKFTVLQAEFEKLTGLQKPRNLMFRDWITYLYNTGCEFLPKVKRKFKKKASKPKKKKKGKRDYNEYLKSAEWRAFRKQAFEFYGRECSECKGTDRLQVHHKHYKNIFNEKLEDVAILCEPCHEKVHGRKFVYV